MAEELQATKIVVSIESIQLCLLNAKRLLQDSAKVSAPTSAALAELSIEEASKAWMLFFVMFHEGEAKASGRELKLAASDATKIETFFEKKRHYLDSLRAELVPAFEDHPPKLKFLTFLADYLELVLPIARKQREYIAQTFESMLGRAFNARSLILESGNSPKRNIFDSFRRRGFKELDRVKNRGFYVNLTRSRKLVTPELQVSTAPLLQGLSSYLIGVLELTLLGLDS